MGHLSWKFGLDRTRNKDLGAGEEQFFSKTCSSPAQNSSVVNSAQKFWCHFFINPFTKFFWRSRCHLVRLFDRDQDQLIVGEFKAIFGPKMSSKMTFLSSFVKFGPFWGVLAHFGQKNSPRSNKNTKKRPINLFSGVFWPYGTPRQGVAKKSVKTNNSLGLIHFNTTEISTRGFHNFSKFASPLKFRYIGRYQAL